MKLTQCIVEDLCYSILEKGSAFIEQILYVLLLVNEIVTLYIRGTYLLALRHNLQEFPSVDG